MTDLPEWTMSHVGLNVTDIEKMADFYMNVLGFQMTDRGPFRNGELLFMSRNPTDHHQIVLAPGRPTDSYCVVNQISLKVQSLAELRTYHDHLQANNVADIDPVDHGTAWSIYFRDPEGNRLEFFMDTPYYVEQPQRDPLDFSMSDDEIDALTRERYGDNPTFQSIEDWRDATFGAKQAAE